MSLTNCCYRCTNTEIPTNLLVKELVFNYLGSVDADSHLTDSIINLAKDATNNANEAADEVDGLITTVNSRVAAVEDSQEATIQRVDNFIATDVIPIVNDAINNTAVEGGVIADTFVTATPNGVGAVARTQRDVNADVIHVLDFGADPTGVEDSYDAIMAAIKHATRIDTGWYRKAAEVHFGPGVFYSSKTLHLHSTVKLVGQSTLHRQGELTLIEFAEGIDGIIVHRYNTHDADDTGITTEGAADGSHIEGIYVQQRGYTPSTLVVTDPSKYSGDYLCHGLFGKTPPIDSQIVFRNELVFNHKGAEATLVDSKPVGAILEINPTSETPSKNSVVTGSLSGATGTVIFEGTSKDTLVLSGVTGTFKVGDKLSDDVEVLGVNTRSRSYVITLSNIVGDINIQDSVTKKGDYGTAFRFRARGTLVDCGAINWPDDAINVYSMATKGTGQTNSNLTSVTGFAGGNIGRVGLRTQGGDANGCRFDKLDFNGIGMYGVLENSFLGNNYSDSHVSTCGMGAYYSMQNQNNCSVFTGCYSEGMYVQTPYIGAHSKHPIGAITIGGTRGDPVREIIPSTRLSNTTFQFSNVILATIRDRLEFKINYDNKNGLVLYSEGAAGGGAGPRISFFTPNSRTDSNKKNFSAYKSASVLNTYSSDGSKLSISTLPRVAKVGYRNFLELNGGSPSVPALAYPIIEDGVITGVDIHHSGSGYKSSPNLIGRGRWTGVQGYGVVHKGEIVDVVITSSPTNLEPFEPQTSLEIDSYSLRAGKDNITRLGDIDTRWKEVYVGGAVGVWGVNPPTSKPEVTGNITDGTALKSLIVALEKYGFITDSTDSTDPLIEPE